MPHVFAHVAVVAFIGDYCEMCLPSHIREVTFLLRPCRVLS